MGRKKKHNYSLCIKCDRGMAKELVQCAREQKVSRAELIRQLCEAELHYWKLIKQMGGENG